MRKETQCNYCNNRILIDDIGKTPEWIRISKVKPNNIAITGCPIHRNIVFDLFQEWMKKAGENDEYEVEGLDNRSKSPSPLREERCITRTGTSCCGTHRLAHKQQEQRGLIK